jgi:hypothetical protein
VHFDWTKDALSINRETTLAVMEDDTLRSLPLALKSLRNDAALVKKLSISGSCSTAATEDMSCDGSSAANPLPGAFRLPARKVSFEDFHLNKQKQPFECA